MAENKDSFENGYRRGSLSARVIQLEKEITRMRNTQIRVFEKLDKLIPAVAELRVKSSLWGAAGGLFAALLALGMALLTKIW